MNSTQWEGSREFISVSMPWRGEGGDDNSKVRRHTSLYRVSVLVFGEQRENFNLFSLSGDCIVHYYHNSAPCS